MSEITTSIQAALFIGSEAVIHGVSFTVAGFYVKDDSIIFVFRHKNGLELKMDSVSCLSSVTINDVPMGVEC